MSLTERLRVAAELARERADDAADEVHREMLLKKAVAAENVAQIESFLTGRPRPPAHATTLQNARPSKK
ncbi:MULTISPECIES: hypothetical protein [Bradyrhizobium]|nr:hypothetical protein [Bradyrhizobium vignae]